MKSCTLLNVRPQMQIINRWETLDLSMAHQGFEALLLGEQVAVSLSVYLGAQTIRTCDKSGDRPR